jgi:hypothetical protein
MILIKRGKMKQRYFIFFLVLLISGFLLTNVLASVPETNRMKLGNISSILPEKEMREHYVKMEPIMLKYFGPAFSNFALNIDADTINGGDATGFTPKTQTLLLGQAKEYARLKVNNQNAALDYLYGSMHHELSHAMYMYGNQSVSFGIQWAWEGWAKFLEEKMNEEMDNMHLSQSVFYDYYMPKDTVAGTESWGSSKQNTNHHLVYGMTTATHYLLVAAASKSLDDLDFVRTMNNAIYDKAQASGKPQMSLEEYKILMKPLLAEFKVDGKDAYEWYFDNPSAYTEGSLGPHVGAYLEGGNSDERSLEVYVFNRVEDNGRRQDRTIADAEVNVKLEDSYGKTILEKSITTDTDGNGRIALGKSIQMDDGAYMIRYETTLTGNKVEGKMFALVTKSARPENGQVFGVLLDENGELLNGDYVSLVNGNGNFVYKKNGLFVFNNKDSRTEVLDFLGAKQEVTLGNFERLFAFTIPKEYVSKAAAKSQEELNAGKMEYNHPTPKKEGFWENLSNWVRGLFKR